ncbi:MAG: class I SAM-dependent methyltransferase [Myxococcales bacterium]|nr:class I SAM-dependent methyltransferase [Myxococcales bacterium]
MQQPDDCAPTTDPERAQRAQLGRLREALQVVVAVALSDLPTTARVLCVGAGTGDELLALARHFEGWGFVAVDPDEEALHTCQQRARSLGVADRCEFHAGPIETTPIAPCDAATSLLVSHWITDPAARRTYFEAIARRLKPAGLLVSADLAHDPAAPDQMEVWRATLRHHGLPAERFDDMAHRLALRPPLEVQALLRSCGFATATPVFQAVLLHAWVARRR